MEFTNLVPLASSPDFLASPACDAPCDFVWDDDDGLENGDWETAPVAEGADASGGPHPPMRQSYGHGIDAIRTAPYRGYPIKDSEVVNFLKLKYGAVTKKMLLDLIADFISAFPANHWLLPPTRSQKRAKGGLVAWLDERKILVVPYIGSRELA
jgi:hypothetical protein